jgi:hypothetical protein
MRRRKYNTKNRINSDRLPILVSGEVRTNRSINYTHDALGRPHTNRIKTWDKRRSLASFVIQTPVRTPKQHVSASYHIFSSW